MGATVPNMGHVRGIELRVSQPKIDVTTFRDSGKKYLSGLSDQTFEISGHWDVSDIVWEPAKTMMHCDYCGRYGEAYSCEGCGAPTKPRSSGMFGGK